MTSNLCCRQPLPRLTCLNIAVPSGSRCARQSSVHVKLSAACIAKIRAEEALEKQAERLASIPMPGFNPGVCIQGKVYHYIGGPLPELGHTPLFALIYFHDPDHELQYLSTHTSNSSLNEQFYEPIYERHTYMQQLQESFRMPLRRMCR